MVDAALSAWLRDKLALLDVLSGGKRLRKQT